MGRSHYRIDETPISASFSIEPKRRDEAALFLTLHMREHRVMEFASVDATAVSSRRAFAASVDVTKVQISNVAIVSREARLVNHKLTSLAIRSQR